MTTTKAAKQTTTIIQYPGFHKLPKLVKRMLLQSETMFFQQAGTSSVRRQSLRRVKSMGRPCLRPIIIPPEEITLRE
jgi:hypothetical protein